MNAHPGTSITCDVTASRLATAHMIINSLGLGLYRYLTQQQLRSEQDLSPGHNALLLENS